MPIFLPLGLRPVDLMAFFPLLGDLVWDLVAKCCDNFNKERLYELAKAAFKGSLCSRGGPVRHRGFSHLLDLERTRGRRPGFWYPAGFTNVRPVIPTVWMLEILNLRIAFLK